MGGDLSVTDAPNGANLKTMGGDITVGEAADHVMAETMGGDIELNAVDGWIQADTKGGDVIAKMVGNPKQGKRDVDISSSAGDIELTVPEGLSMSVDLQIECTRQTDQCKIISDFPLEREETRSGTDYYGHTRVNILGKGAIAGGTHQIRLHTVNGRIVLKK
jgi:DUF4097 and DUF4098 domain-containing protein YvlB